MYFCFVIYNLMDFMVKMQIWKLERPSLICFFTITKSIEFKRLLLGNEINTTIVFHFFATQKNNSTSISSISTTVEIFDPNGNPFPLFHPHPP